MRNIKRVSELVPGDVVKYLGHERTVASEPDMQAGAIHGFPVADVDFTDGSWARYFASDDVELVRSA